MTIATFSLPVDIPWQRIAFSEDMMDKVACDRRLPSRWRSSLAVFRYQPPDELQRQDGSIVSYLKVSCTITGFQEDGREIQMRERLGRSGWAASDMTDHLGALAGAYFPCMGAILEVVVAPHEDDDRFGFKDYPYFADFDPKKREMYEVVTETGDTMSRTLENVNVRHGQTTLQSHEVRDSTTLSGSLSASYMGVTAAGTATQEGSTTDLSQQRTENVRTTDAAREARESFSHVTQLTQMYHQLDSYHLGTNRASFFMLPRPHTVQSPATFVNGPREIEGVQEFMLVVVRPKEMEDFCVEAYLETAHLTGDPIYDWGETTTPLHLKVECPGASTQFGAETSAKQNGFIVDRTVGAFLAPGVVPHGEVGGYIINYASSPEDYSYGVDTGNSYSFVVSNDSVTVEAVAAGRIELAGRKQVPATVEVDATVFLKRAVPLITGHQPGLMITGRAVCSCPRNLGAQIGDHPSIVYEKSLSVPSEMISVKDKSMDIRTANRLGAQLKRELLQSIASADRYPRGTVGLLDTQLFAGMMGVQIRHAEGETNARIVDSPGIDDDLKRLIAAVAPRTTRSELLEMPLPEQVERFNFTFEQAVQLRRVLTDLSAPAGPRPMPVLELAEVPPLGGLRLHEAKVALSAAGLRCGDAPFSDSPAPAGTVIEQNPQPGVEVEPGSEVSLRLASGLSVRLPDIRGLGLSEAGCKLRGAGLRSEPTVEGKPTPEAEVAEQNPPAGTLVTPNSPTSITLRHRAGSRH